MASGALPEGHGSGMLPGAAPCRIFVEHSLRKAALPTCLLGLVSCALGLYLWNESRRDRHP